ncbi:MAG: DNA translocase FtsK 4TM domain-containing protein [Phycisphaerales bacterium]|nr:MAG: DNA translocase FtsK 4TM domain-containing protein [Phycisphaerales bacterium]
MTHEEKPTHPRSLLWPICALVLCVFLWPAMLTFDAGDWPSPNQFPHHTPTMNACGVVGAWCSYQLFFYVGDGVYPLLLFATLAALVRLVRGELRGIPERLFGLTVVVACTSVSAHLISARAATPLPTGHGGLVGYALGDVLTHNLSRVGTLIVLVSSLIVGVLFATEGWILTLPVLFRRVGSASGKAVARVRVGASAVAGAAAAVDDDAVTAEETEALLTVQRPELRINPNRSKKAKKPTDDEPDRGTNDQCDDDDEAASPRSKKTAKAKQGPKVNVPSLAQLPITEPYPRQIENWRLPSIELLHEPEFSFTAKQETFVRQQARVLEQTLQEFRLDAHVVEIDTGPVITMFELKLGVGIKVSQIATLSNDIARALKAHAIRVVAPISGKNTVGIEVPNIEKEKVRLKELMTLAGRKASDMGLPLFLGKDVGGAAIVADLTKMPHLLIAGTTGSGKSVCLNAIVLSLLMTKRPDHVKMIVVDPKMVEMSHYKDMPHLMCPIVTDLARAEKILEWAVTKMEERYALLAEARVKNVAGYNRLGEEEICRRFDPATDAEKARISTHLPYIVIVIDELADLMMTAAKEVEHHLSRLAQKSRAVGIHIIVATQRPEARVVTGLIKSNLPARICFRVASRMDSRIVLDQNGGEVLMGQGDMLFLPPGSHKLLRAQGTFLEDAEVHAVLDDLATRAKPEFHPELIRLRRPGADSSDVRDPLFEDAVGIILESKRGSVSLLQRRLTVGYSRASRLIDQMADAGIVGEYKGSQAREVLMSVDEWEALQGQLARDAEDDYEADRDEPEESDEDAFDELPALSDDHDIRG